MFSIADLIERSGDLKPELVAYALGPRMSKAFRQAMRARYGDVAVSDDLHFTNFVDHFILQHRLPDGRTVVERFVAVHPELTESERAMLLGWQDVVEGVFEVGSREGDALMLFNLIDELTYRVFSNMGPKAFAPMTSGAFLITRLAPVEDVWILSGASAIYPASTRTEILTSAADLALRHPKLALRNPDKLVRGWEMQREERQRFTDFFGADLVVLPGAQVEEKMREYMHFRTYEARGADGMTAAERGSEWKGYVLPHFVIPDEMAEAETVALIYDEEEGLSFYTGFGLVREAFENPDRAGDRTHRQAVLDYLKKDSVSAVPLRRLADRYPEQASRLFQRLLRKPGFIWERDGEALLRKHKAAHFKHPKLPCITPVGKPLLEHYARARDAENGAGRPLDRPAPLAKDVTRRSRRAPSGIRRERSS